MAADAMSEACEFQDYLLDVATSDFYQSGRGVPARDTKISTRWIEGESRRPLDGRAAVLVDGKTIVGYLPPAYSSIASVKCCHGVVIESRAGGEPVITVRFTVSE